MFHWSELHLYILLSLLSKGELAYCSIWIDCGLGSLYVYARAHLDTLCLLFKQC